MKRRGGFLLIAVLFMITMLLVAGLGFLAKRSAQYDSANSTLLSAQAQSLALVGLEQTMVKLNKDHKFPPERAIDQKDFAWTETVYDLDGTTVVGSYTARLDLQYSEPPYSVLRIESSGLVGAPDAPRALHTLIAEIDVTGDAASNPRYYQIINLLEGGP
jgi:hypothetical protein